MNNENFDWSLIRSFLAALEHGSLLGAARQLKSSQPTQGRRIAELEKQLGVTLFERTGRGLRPTQTALSLAGPARQMEAAALQLTQGLARTRTELTGTVRLTASTTVASYLLPDLLTALHAALPQIQIEVVSSNAVSNLLRREADIALRMVAPQQASVIARRVGLVQLGVCAHASYLKKHGVPREPIDLLGHVLIGHDRDDSIIRGFRHFGVELTAESFALRSDDYVANWQLVRSGAGIGFVPAYMARTDRQVEHILAQLQIPPLPMWLAVHRELRSSPRIRAVYDFLAEALPQALE